MHILGITPGEGFEASRWRAVARSGLDALLIRERHLEAGPLLDLVRRVQDLAPELPLWVHGRLDVALAANCGLHAPEAYPDLDRDIQGGTACSLLSRCSPIDPHVVGGQSPPTSSGLIPLSRPLHAPDQWLQRCCASQLLVGPILAVPGKGTAWGILKLHAFLEGLPLTGPRLLALGGLTPASLPGLRHPRLQGLALIRALWTPPDPAGRVAELRAAWDQGLSANESP